MKMANRLDALEGKSSPPPVERWHDIVQRGNQTLEEAIDAYGRDKIGPDDGMIVWRTTTPRFDADGNKISFRNPPESEPRSSIK